MSQLFFSIIIPTFNRPARLAACLSAIAELAFAPDRFEVIVVDDGSDAPLDQVVAPYQSQLNLTLIRQTNAGPAAARNAGATHAKGQFLVFTDDDCTPLPDWLNAFQQQCVADPIALLGGQTLNALPNNPYSTASQLLIDYLYDYFNQAGRPSNFFASNNFAMASDRFHALGGFDTAFPLAAGEDREFCDRWLHQGYPMQYVPEAQIRHAHHLTLRKFWRQHFNYGRGAFCFHQVRAQRNQAQIEVEPWAFYFNLLTYPFQRAPFRLAAGLSCLMFLSQLANVVGFFWEKSRQPPRKLKLEIDVQP